MSAEMGEERKRSGMRESPKLSHKHKISKTMVVQSKVPELCPVESRTPRKKVSDSAGSTADFGNDFRDRVESTTETRILHKRQR